MVPPISNEITWSKFNSLATELAKITPPAGPDSTNLTGKSEAFFTLVKLPPEVISKNEELKPERFKFVSRLLRYLDIKGFIYAFIAVVVKRSNSLISGQTSEDIEICNSGNFLFKIVFKNFSFFEFA